MNAEAFSVRAFVGPGLAGGSTSGRCSGSRGTTTRGATSGTPGSSSQASPVRGRLPGARPLRTRDSPDVALRLGSTARREARSLGIVQRSWTRSTTTTSRATACRSATGARGRDEQCSRRLIQNVATSSEAAGPKKHQRWRCRRVSHWVWRGRREMSTGLRNGVRPSPFAFPLCAQSRTKPCLEGSLSGLLGPSVSSAVSVREVAARGVGPVRFQRKTSQLRAKTQPEGAGPSGWSLKRVKGIVPSRSERPQTLATAQQGRRGGASRRSAQPRKTRTGGRLCLPPERFEAGEGDRTLDIYLGKVTLYR